MAPDSDLLTRRVSPGVEVSDEDAAYVLEMVDRYMLTRTSLYGATHACLLRAVRSDGLGQLAPRGPTHYQYKCVVRVPAFGVPYLPRTVA